MTQIQVTGHADWQVIEHIEAACFTDERFSRRQLRYLLDKARSKSWIARGGDEAQGYCLGLFPALPRPSRLYSLAVHPRFHGRGIARSLVHEFLRESLAAGYSRARLEVSCDNRRAIDLYEGVGFRVIATLPAYYRNGDDALRMQCDLGGYVDATLIKTTL